MHHKLELTERYQFFSNIHINIILSPSHCYFHNNTTDTVKLQQLHSIQPFLRSPLHSSYLTGYLLSTLLFFILIKPRYFFFSFFLTLLAKSCVTFTDSVFFSESSIHILQYPFRKNHRRQHLFYIGPHPTCHS